MKKKESKWLYLWTGIGCGIVVSGIFMVVIGLQINKEWIGLKETIKEMQNTAIHQEEVTTQEETTGTNTSNTAPEETSQEVVTEKTPEESITYKTIDIPSSYGATFITQFLEDEGIVEDAGAFLSYIHEHGASTKLRTGIKEMPIGGDYETLLDILLGKKQD